MISSTFRHVLSKNNITNIVFIFAILEIVLLEIIFAKHKELFDGGAMLAALASNISISLIAGYLFYIVSAVKLDVDRINRSKKASTIVINRILNHTNYLFVQLSGGDDSISFGFINEENIKSLLDGKLFSDEFYGAQYLMPGKELNFGRKSLHYFVFNDYVPSGLKIKCELELYFSLLEPEIQIAFCNYFNCQFYSMFSDDVIKQVFTNRKHPISDFRGCFLELVNAVSSLKFEYEKVYGPLDPVSDC
ncbi:hypothetical protein GOY18_09745 [Aeromonas hydrophila]|uniref:hypothetical protein n=1 Tax=Aeromonas hydrophila TaxID=644 RepID=UPI001C5AB1A1|nr:hypothetical protein [Aeromonas hydrophila]MBW3810775.1 hypothetical protein [Aeromonas hydrophila]